MNPGRELDALVAKRIMGWNVGGYMNMQWVCNDGKDTGWYLTEFGSQECNPFSPSTDIAAAWEVVDKLGERFSFYFHTRGRMTDISVIHWPDNLKGGFDVSGETAPHAICLAALKAVGVEV